MSNKIKKEDIKFFPTKRSSYDGVKLDIIDINDEVGHWNTYTEDVFRLITVNKDAKKYHLCS